MYRVSARPPVDGLPCADVEQLERAEPSGDLLSLRGAVIAVPSGYEPLALGETLQLVGADARSGSRVVIWTAPVEAVDFVDSPIATHAFP